MTPDLWGTQFDGLSWTIAQGHHLRVLDTRDSLQQVVWQVTDLPGKVWALTACATLERVLLNVAQAPRSYGLTDSLNVN